jgi:7,8-dihydro-6-hydroxymethylpterin-pyrophosphokinase
MQIQRTSMMTNVTRTLDLDITEEQVSAYMNGALIQNAFPNLTASEREFILTGITAEEWDTMSEEE